MEFAEIFCQFAKYYFLKGKVILPLVMQKLAIKQTFDITSSKSALVLTA